MCALITAATAAAPAEGDIPDHPALSAKWYFGVGLFIPKTTTEARLSSTTLGVGAIIDFEGFDAVVHALGSVYMCVDQDVWSIHYWPDGSPAGNPLWGGLTEEPADPPPPRSIEDLKIAATPEYGVSRGIRGP